MPRPQLSACLLACGLLGAGTVASAQTRLPRFPDIHGDRVVFVYAGDLWTAPAVGGDAVRLTSHPGLEIFPRFSPDGRWIAFTGQYDGDEQVYVIPAGGGVPKQLTWYPARGPLPPRWGYDNQVYGWTPDGEAVLFRSLMDGWDLTDSRLYTVPREGGLPVPLPMVVSGAGDLSPDGRKVVFSPLIRDFRTWKRYQGGWAQDLWLFDLATHEAENFTDHPRTDRDPMWIGETIYFASDRDGKLNLYAYTPANRETRQLTSYRDWDVRWPSKGEDGEIVFELGGELHVYDTASGETRPVPVTVPSDAVPMRPAQVAAAGQIESFDLSPKGERALFVARGDVFTAPIEKGFARNLTRSSRYHDRGASWAPDGRRIALISDRTGEEELYLIEQDGSGEPEALTEGGRARRYSPRWSPDGQRLAFGDKDGKVWVVTVADKKLVEAADDGAGRVSDYVWSPDGAYLAFSLAHPNGFRSLHIWSAADGALRKVTDETAVNAYRPAWDPKGDYLFYLADREFDPLIGSLEFNYAVTRETVVLALALRKDAPHPFPPESDEVSLEEDEKKGDEEGEPAKGKKAEEEGKKEEEEEEEKNGEKKKEPKPVRIDFDGLAERVSVVPIAPATLFGLSATEEFLLVVRSGGFHYERQPDPKPALVAFSRKERKESVLAEGIDDYALSFDGKKVLVQQEAAYNLFEITSGKPEKKTISTADLKVNRVPAEEWAEIFDEVWRRFRDYFYVETMHGYDWEALREQYRPQLASVGHRSDLNYVLGEMIAELNVSHAYIQGGDFELPPRPRVALPGARFEFDAASGRYRIARIFRGQNDEDRYRSPLTEVGVDARPGDYVLAIDGEELRGSDSPYRLLRHKADRPVTLTLNDRPSLEGARKATFRPIDSETNLLYNEWVAANREKVAQATHDRVGYLHLPDMGSDGIREFIKWFYPQVRKEGLIVDVRSNGGGNVSQMIIERLRRTLLSVDVSRTTDWLATYPSAVFHGSLVCLLNETSASDGDIFAAMFREAGLGPLIGKRSWGGVVGISGHGPLIDGGQVFVPESGTASAKTGEWIIEGYGVDPDIVVENDPKSLIEGRDPQLEGGIEEVLRAMRENPKRLPPRPADPVRTR